jgi:hypothetical protein
MEYDCLVEKGCKMTGHFTFFESFYTSVKDLDSSIKSEYYEVIFEYALYDNEPDDTVNPVVMALFTLSKPNIDKSKARRESGRNGGRSKQTASKTKQIVSKTKQTASKTKQNEANGKQVPSDKDMDKDKEKKTKAKKDFFDTGVFSKLEFEELSKYRAMIKHPFRTQQAVNGVSKAFMECYSHGYSFGDLFNLMAEKQWKTINLAWLENANILPSNNPTVKKVKRYV